MTPTVTGDQPIGASALSTPTHALMLQGISKAYGNVQALDGADFTLEPGTIHALLGGNGSGKSTLIKILAGVVKADAGSIMVGGKELAAADQTPSRATDMGIHFVHQQNSTFADLTVAENLALGHGFETGALRRVKWKAQHRRAQEILDRFEVPVSTTTPVSELGSALQMMVAIARALQSTEGATDGVLVLDEPTASLPRQEVQTVLEALTRYAAGGQSIVLVTHRLGEVLQVCGEATVLRDGTVGAHLRGAELNRDRLVQEIAGRKVAALGQRPQVTAEAGKEAVLTLQAQGEGLEFSVRPGEVVGLAGLLGSGRSSLLRRMFGVAERSEELYIDGKKVPSGDPVKAMRAGVAYVPEDRPRDANFADLSIAQNMSIAKLGGVSRGLRVSSRIERRVARQLIGSFEIKVGAETNPIGSLSGGNQQKVILARWMQRNPRVLLLDEPTQGVDVGARQEIHQLIRRAAMAGAAVVVVTSEFEELTALCDRAAVVHEGQIVDYIPSEEMSEDVLNARVYSKEKLS
jgi:ribose transport system ATP-binding protein